MKKEKAVSKNVQQIVQRAGIDLLTTAASKLREVSTETMAVLLEAMSAQEIPSLPFVVLPKDVFKTLQDAAVDTIHNREQDDHLIALYHEVYEAAVVVVNSLRSQCPDMGSVYEKLEQAVIAVDPERIVPWKKQSKKKSTRKAGRR